MTTEQSDNQYTLQGVIEEFRERFAIIKLNYGQFIEWPIKNLPEDCQINCKVEITINNESTSKNQQEQVAKNILNEILKTQ